MDEPPAVLDQVVLTLRRELDAVGFSSVKIQMPDAPFLYQGIERAREPRETPDVWMAIDYTASHVYDYQKVMTNPELYDERLKKMHAASAGKPFLSTEICVNDP